MSDESNDKLTVRKSITVERPLVETFEFFTMRLTEWWPLDSHSIGEDRVVQAVMEPGGRIYEIWDDGTECEWGRVTEYAAPDRLVVSWKPNDNPLPPTTFEVRFTALADTRTRIDLEHVDWEGLGEGAAETRDGYVTGWDFVLGRFVAALESQDTRTAQPG